jgi:hypothetical protein
MSTGESLNGLNGFEDPVIPRPRMKSHNFTSPGICCNQKQISVFEPFGLAEAVMCHAENFNGVTIKGMRDE